MIDTDLRRAGLLEAAKIRPEAGLIEVLTGKLPVDQVLIADQLPGLDLLPVASNSFMAEDLFSGEGMQALLHDMAARYDRIILDTAPLLGVAESRTIARLVDAAILVIKWGDTPINAVKSALNGLVQDGVPLVGALFSMVDAGEEAYGALYYSSQIQCLLPLGVSGGPPSLMRPMPQRWRAGRGAGLHGLDAEQRSPGGADARSLGPPGGGSGDGGGRPCLSAIDRTADRLAGPRGAAARGDARPDRRRRSRPCGAAHRSGTRDIAAARASPAGLGRGGGRARLCRVAGAWSDSPQAIRALAQSYAAAPYLRDSAPWRIRFGVTVWSRLDAQTRDHIVNETAWSPRHRAATMPMRWGSSPARPPSRWSRAASRLTARRLRHEAGGAAPDSPASTAAADASAGMSSATSVLAQTKMTASAATSATTTGSRSRCARRK
ncbi:Tyrosine-protein kinase YwqD [Sphingomonas paucimobilis]|nr:Tyrosine-protein kinase YwqD [Sphingomonas paucimobilis]